MPQVDEFKCLVDLWGATVAHSGGTQSWAASPPHWKEPAEAGHDTCWPPPRWGALGVSQREPPGQTQDTWERWHLSAGLLISWWLLLERPNYSIVHLNSMQSHWRFSTRFNWPQELLKFNLTSEESNFWCSNFGVYACPMWTGPLATVAAFEFAFDFMWWMLRWAGAGFNTPAPRCSLVCSSSRAQTLHYFCHGPGCWHKMLNFLLEILLVDFLFGSLFTIVTFYYPHLSLVFFFFFNFRYSSCYIPGLCFCCGLGSSHTPHKLPFETISFSPFEPITLPHRAPPVQVGSHPE